MSEPLWAHQREAIEFVRSLWSREQNGAMLAMAMGTGKSRAAIELACESASEVLIVCPLRVVEVWRMQFERFAPDWRFLPLDDRIKSVAEKKRIAQCDFRYHSGARIAIAINYDSARSEPFASWALSRSWELAILDESHRIKAPAGRTSRWATRLGLVSLRRLALTGTPMAHTPLDVWGQFRFLNPYLLEPTFSEFKFRYAVMGGYFNKEIVGWRNLDRLEQDFRKIAFQVDSSVLDLPPQMDQTLACDLGAKGARIYREMEQQMIAWIDENQSVTAANAMVKLLRLQQITGGHVPNEFGGSDGQIDWSKQKLLEDLLDDLKEPVVVFARFRADLAAISAACSRFGEDGPEADYRRWQYYELSGSHDGSDAWRKWDKPRCVLGVQIQAGGVGVDLSKARIGVYYSLGFSLADYLQSRARIHRPPQTRPCMFVHLQVRGSVDEYVLEAVHARRDLVDSVLKDLKRKGAHNAVLAR